MQDGTRVRDVDTGRACANCREKSREVHDGLCPDCLSDHIALLRAADDTPEREEREIPSWGRDGVAA